MLPISWINIHSSGAEIIICLLTAKELPLAPVAALLSLIAVVQSTNISLLPQNTYKKFINKFFFLKKEKEKKGMWDFTVDSLAPFG